MAPSREIVPLRSNDLMMNLVGEKIEMIERLIDYEAD